MSFTIPYQCIIIGHSAVEQELLELLLRKEHGIIIAGKFRSVTEASDFLKQHPADMALSDWDTLQQFDDTAMLPGLLPVVIWSCSSWPNQTGICSITGMAEIILRKPLRPHLLYRALAEAIEHLEQWADADRPVAEASGLKEV